MLYCDEFFSGVETIFEISKYPQAYFSLAVGKDIGKRGLVRNGHMLFAGFAQKKIN